MYSILQLYLYLRSDIPIDKMGL